MEIEHSHSQEEKNHNVGTYKVSTLTSDSTADDHSTNEQTNIPYDIRVAVLGNVDAGKSTLTGVLTHGEYDDGNGKERLHVMTHQHEKESGRTSSAGHQFLGFSVQNQPIYQPVAASASRKVRKKANEKLLAEAHHIVSFTDLCGHKRYLRTTISGVCQTRAHIALLVIEANKFKERKCKDDDAEEMIDAHLDLVAATQLPLCIVINKMDTAEVGLLASMKSNLRAKLGRINRANYYVKKESDLPTAWNSLSSTRCPIFEVSCVTGQGISLFRDFLAGIRPDMCKHVPTPLFTPPKTPHATNSCDTPSTDCLLETKVHKNDTQMYITEVFQVDGTGLVVCGPVVRGCVYSRQVMMLGPYEGGQWIPVVIRNIQRRLVDIPNCSAPLSCGVALRAVSSNNQSFLVRERIRKGMVLLDERSYKQSPPQMSQYFEAKIHIMHHQTSIKPKYRPLMYCGNIRSPVILLGFKKILRSKFSMDDGVLRSGDTALAFFRVRRSEGEFLQQGAPFLIGEGKCKAFGTITRTQSMLSEEVLERLRQVRMGKKRWIKRKAESS